MKEYDCYRIYVAYPENWLLEESAMESADGSLVLSNGSGAFWLLKKYPFGTNPDDIAKEAVDAMLSEYGDIEIERFDKVLSSGRAVSGFDMTFFYLDLMNTAKVYCFEQDSQTMAVFWQTGNQLVINQDEEISLEDVLEAVTHSFFVGKRQEHHSHKHTPGHYCDCC
ncbi:MAG: hypothetical protein LBT89_06915 [Planctomycetaceae bacterium]|jgi:IMP cyclohydrolase|nr:hypothetical protein [Planctomycetaceae bacterium]